MNRKTFQQFLVFMLLMIGGVACHQSGVRPDFNGFWQGPHPEDVNKKFYIHIYGKETDTLVEAYWTDHHFFNSTFKVDSLFLKGDSIGFFVPMWGCHYNGKLSGPDEIVGGFSCPGEAFDTVRLSRHNEAARFLTEAKPNCHNPGYHYAYIQPKQLDDKLNTSRFETKGDSLFIDSLMTSIIRGDYGRLNSFLLLKDNRLVCEEYFYGYTRNDVHPIESSTKSITSLLIGIAKDKGMMSDINEPLYKLFPGYPDLHTGEYRKITVKDLLTMTSGFKVNDEALFGSNNRIDFALKRKLAHKPGSQFAYDGGNTEILGAIIKEKTGQFADTFAKQYLFAPLGITNYDWDIHKQNGYPSMAGALGLLPRDMAKIGLLVLNQGSFGNRQIVSKEWIEESTAPQVATHIDSDHYGYQWWNIDLKSHGKTYNTIWANGWGSQFIFIIPELNVVIVTTGYNYAYDSWAIRKGISNYLYLLDTNQ